MTRACTTGVATLIIAFLVVTSVATSACTGNIGAGDGEPRTIEGSMPNGVPVAGDLPSSARGDRVAPNSGDRVGGGAGDSAPTSQAPDSGPEAASDSGATATDSGPPPAADSGPTPPPPAPPPKTGLLVGYYGSWTKTTLPASAVPWKSLTHVAHAFVLPSSSGGLTNVATYVDAGLIAAAHAAGVKIVASVGGAGANFDANVDATVRAKTVAALVALCKTSGYDGIDLDWEFPTSTTGAAWSSLITELRTALDAVDPALTISAAVSAEPSVLAFLPTAGLKTLSWVGVMSYDYAGPWSSSIGQNAPLYPTKGGDGGSVTDSMSYLTKTRALPASRLLVGLPFYGYQFAGTALATTAVTPTTALDYRDVASRIGTSGWTQFWDASAQVPYLSRSASPGFLSFDDAKSIGNKCTYAKAASLGGAIVWHLAGDTMTDGTHPLLDAAQGCR